VNKDLHKRVVFTDLVALGRKPESWTSGPHGPQNGVVESERRMESDDPSNQSARHTELCPYNLQLMINTEENLLSRRAFIKSALAGAAGSLIVGIDKGAGRAGIGPQHNPQGSSLTKLSLSEASQRCAARKCRRSN
jgi:hypothetical protein